MSPSHQLKLVAGRRQSWGGGEREGENSFQQTKENYVKFVAVVGCKVVKRQQTSAHSLKIFSSVVWGERAQVISLRKYPVIEKQREQGLTNERSSCRDDESKHMVHEI